MNELAPLVAAALRDDVVYEMLAKQEQQLAKQEEQQQVIAELQAKVDRLVDSRKSCTPLRILAWTGPGGATVYAEGERGIAGERGG